MKLPRLQPRIYAIVTFVALALLCVIIVTGALVRLTGSGLGCHDWPACEKHQLVAGASYHSEIEFGNRAFTGVVGVVVIIAVLGALVRVPRRRDMTWLSLALVLGVIVQAVIGGLAVRHKLLPYWVMAHFIASMLLVWAALVLYNRAAQPDSPARPIVHRDYLILGRVVFLLASAVVVVGTMVTGTGPHGGDANVRRLGFSLHTITKVHGTLVWLLLALTLLTLRQLHVAHASRTIMQRGEILVAALVVQGAVGYAQYATRLPVSLVTIHVAGAVAVWISVIWFNLAMYERYEPIDLAVRDETVDDSPDA